MIELPQIALTFYGPATAAAGRRTASVALPEAATAGALRMQLAVEWPALAPLLPRCALACNGALITDDAPLRSGDCIDLLPPVSGG